MRCKLFFKQGKDFKKNDIIAWYSGSILNWCKASRIKNIKPDGWYYYPDKSIKIPLEGTGLLIKN